MPEITHPEKLDDKVDAYEWRRHADDTWFDEVVLFGPGNSPLLRVLQAYRYKTSGLSGDEWRTSWAWQAYQTVYVNGETDPFERDPRWSTYDGPYHALESACAAFYPGIWSSQKGLIELPVTHIDLMRKGKISYRANSPDGKQPLLVAAGHLPWALVIAKDAPVGTDEMHAHNRATCFQPGCSEPAVSTYVLKELFGDPVDAWKGRPAVTETWRQGKKVELRMARRFCPLHLRRGDCGLEDADKNYEVVEGPGPDKAVGWQKYAREAKRVVRRGTWTQSDNVLTRVT